MNWLGKIGVTLFLAGWTCFFSMFVAAFLGGPKFLFQILLMGFSLDAFLGFVLMFISVLYDRYRQLKTEEIHPRI
ncbi:MAG: hypothetical protein HXS52_09905 [Theionarchaea archaeon]|nr:hypothetical protein [Theionarchaea archaeon]MBU7038238.1 hypothetical protein [Theionarchaea archaeon]